MSLTFDRDDRRFQASLTDTVDPTLLTTQANTSAVNCFMCMHACSCGDELCMCMFKYAFVCMMCVHACVHKPCHQLD